MNRMIVKTESFIIYYVSNKEHEALAEKVEDFPLPDEVRHYEDRVSIVYYRHRQEEIDALEDVLLKGEFK